MPRKRAKRGTAFQSATDGLAAASLCGERASRLLDMITDWQARCPPAPQTRCLCHAMVC